jgi:hypothetical protein
MKTHTRILLLGATGLLMAGSLLAHTATNHVDHKDINFTAVTATYVFHGGTEATWTARPNGSYKVVLKQDPSQNDASNSLGATSLLTLGVQGIDNATEIKVESGTDVELYDSTSANPRWVRLGSQKVALAKTDTIMGSGSKPVVNDNHVSFIRYKGTTCTLVVTSAKERKGHTKWHGSGPNKFTSHDNTPPGVPPGAEP